MNYVKESLDAGAVRMAKIESRLDDLQGWKNKTVGIVIGASAVISLLINWLFNMNS